MPDGVAIDILWNVFILYSDSVRNPDHHSDVSDHIANAQDFVEQNKALVYDEGNVSETAARLFGIVVPPDVFV